jgi:hypothetical protein
MNRVRLGFATLILAFSTLGGFYADGRVYAFSGFQDAQDGPKRVPEPAPCGLEVVYVGRMLIVVNSCSGDIVFIG